MAPASVSLCENVSGALYIGGTGVLASAHRPMIYCEVPISLAQHSSAAAGQSSPDVADLRPVLQVPAVGGLILPAHISRILPQQLHLGCCVPRVPQRISELFPRTCRGLDSLPQTRGERDQSPVWWELWVVEL